MFSHCTTTHIMITQHNFKVDINNLDTLGQMIQLKPSESFEGGTVLLLPKTFGPAIHFHPGQDEIFQVLQGELEVLKGKKWHTLKAGEKLFIPKRTPHTFRNATSEEVVFDFAVTPKIGLTYLLLTMDELVKAGKITSLKKIRSVIYLNQALAAYPQVTHNVKPPQWIIRLLAATGKAFGLSIEKERFRAEFLRPVKIWKGAHARPGDIAGEILEQALF